MKITNAITTFKANKMPTTQAKYVDKKLKEAKNVDIICHDMTDRDSANSALAMWEYLNNKGISARVILSQKKPKSLNLRTYDFNMIQASNIEELSKIQPDVAFCVDFGGTERVSPNVLKHIENTPLVMGFDHHNETDISKGNYIQFKKTIKNSQEIHSSADFYSDTSAKSTTSIIYRFFEALEEEINSSLAYDLFLGFIDDAIKRNLIKCDAKKGTIEAQKKLIEDKNAYEIFSALKNKLSKEEISIIAKTIDVLSSLTKEEQAFKDSLKDKLHYSQNGKIAYVEIPPNDEEWSNLGGDNVITSRILNNFRQEVLAQNNEVEIVITFYEAHGNYRLSAHSKINNLLNFFKYIEDKKIPDFTQKSGGHQNRAGGGLNTNDPEKCHKWVQNIITCDDFLD